MKARELLQSQLLEQRITDRTTGDTVQFLQILQNYRNFGEIGKQYSISTRRIYIVKHREHENENSKQTE